MLTLIECIRTEIGRKKRELNITASISNRGNRGEEALGESGECQKEKPVSGRSRAK